MQHWRAHKIVISVDQSCVHDGGDGGGGGDGGEDENHHVQLYMFCDDGDDETYLHLKLGQAYWRLSAGGFEASFLERSVELVALPRSTDRTKNPMHVIDRYFHQDHQDHNNHIKVPMPTFELSLMLKAWRFSEPLLGWNLIARFELVNYFPWTCHSYHIATPVVAHS